VVLSGSGDPAVPAVTIVQSAKTGNNASSLAFTGSVTAGNLLLVAFGASTSGGFTSPIVVSDTLGNTWVQQVNAQNTGQPTMTAIATCVTASSGADTVSVSGAGGANSQIVIAEISGNFTATADATGVATSGTTPPTLSLTEAYDLFFTAGYANPENGLPSVVGPEIFVQQITGNFWALNLAYVMESSSGAYASSLNGSTYGTVIASVALLANPPSSPGVDGDWYLNTTTGILWGPKTGGLWSKANITALDSVSLCTGFTPTNGQLLQYTTGGSPNPCWTAATAGGPFVNLQSTTPGTPQTGNSNISGTGIFGAGLLFGTEPISFGAGTQPLYNIWIGATGASNTTGSYNSAHGYNALNANTTGTYNSALGPNVLSSNTSGASNSALGYNALSSNISGSQNSALGAYALSSNTGSYNSAHGYDALNANTSGNGNSAHGYQALYFNTTGTYNSALGFGAGYTANSAYANVSGSHNSWVGYNSGPGSATQYSYQTVIGAAATGTCSNCVVLGRAGGLDTVYAGDAGVDPMVVLALATTPVLSTALKTCTATTGIPWRASVTDAVAPALGVALTGGGTVFANVHCSLTTGHYIVDGL
jgi:hypothetical protein